jgi:hypothetical protein
VADELLRLSQALRLLGAEVILTRLRPAIAQTLSELGTDLHFIRTYATIQGALAQMALRQRNLTVSRVGIWGGAQPHPLQPTVKIKLSDKNHVLGCNGDDRWTNDAM